MNPIPVLFLQSQTFLGADSALHAMLLRHYDRRKVSCHVAANPVSSSAPDSDAFPRFQAIPDCHVLPTHFGPSLDNVPKRERLRRTVFEGPRVPLTLLRLAGYIRRNKIQILHGTEKPRDALYGTVLGKLTGAKSVVHMHVNYGDWQSKATKWALRNCDAIIGVSEYTARGIVQAGFARERVFAVPNCFDARPDIWDPQLSGQEVRREFGIDPDAPVVGIVARLFKWKGHADLVEAMARVREALPGVRLVIVGKDDPRAHDGKSFRNELEGRIAELGLTPNVIFTGFRSDTPRMFAMFDVYAMPTWEEPWGMVFLEAAAMRKPSVAYRSGGVPEVVSENESGFLVEPKDIAGLAEKITLLLTDQRLRERMGHAGSARARRDFSPDQMCHNVLAVYRTILGVRTASPEANHPERATV
ncbi:MAG: glycosyltransferase family 4 protein [Akkermansiaceae bacterium]|nr:glycosyltransferase family 4 protein [Armatimonadota bacterium]